MVGYWKITLSLLSVDCFFNGAPSILTLFIWSHFSGDCLFLKHVWVRFSFCKLEFCSQSYRMGYSRKEPSSSSLDLIYRSFGTGEVFSDRLTSCPGVGEGGVESLLSTKHYVNQRLALTLWKLRLEKDKLCCASSQMLTNFSLFCLSRIPWIRQEISENGCLPSQETSNSMSR